MSAFMDDLIMWSDTRLGLDKITLEALRRLRDNRLCISPNKCEWAQHQIEFLGYMVSEEGVEMTDEKVKTLKKIEPVNSLKDAQHLLGFANFYRRFIKDYSKIILLITNSTSLAANEWRTSPEIKQAQQKLVTPFTMAPVLRHFDPGKPAIVETDASDFTLGGILSQRHEGRLHPIAFHSRKFTEAEINYNTADKELLAIVDCFKRWRRYLEGANHQVQVISDYQNLELLQTTKVLNQRQARWAQELAGYDFKIFFRPGKHNGKADYLSRRPEYRLEKGGDRKPEMIHKQDHISEEPSDYIIPLAHKDRICAIPPIQWRKDFLEEVRSAAHLDEQYKSGLRSLSANPSSSDCIKLSEYLTVEDGNILHFRGRLYVPKTMIPTILESEHDSKVAGHFVQDKTIELIWRNFWWPGMDSDIEKYIQACPDCERDKSRHHRRYVLFSPLQLPYTPWQSIAMDFITDLPQSNNCTELWVVIDRFSKMAHFIPLEQDKKNAEDLALIFASEV